MAGASYILSMRHSFKMGWANARRIFAKMIYFCSVRDRSFCENICDTMGADGTSVNAELAVAESVSRACPQPAPLSLLDFGPKAVWQRSTLRNSPSKRISVVQIPSEMLATVAMCFVRVLTAFDGTRRTLSFIRSTRRLFVDTSCTILPTVVQNTESLCIVRFRAGAERAVFHNNLSIAHGMAT